MSDWTIAGSTAFACVLLLYVGRRAFANRISYPLPPGPPGLPWIGNVIGIDASGPWKTYAEWGKIYGGIVYSRLMGKEIIIINSEKIARDLFDNRSKNYSDRPHLVTNELYGIGFNSVLMPYGNRWRSQRRFFHQTFRLDAVPRFIPLQHRKACQLLRQLLENPEQFDNHVVEYTASLSLNSTYDYDPESRQDDIVDTATNVLAILVRVLRPDVAVLASTFPYLLNLPSWFPGMSFKKEMEMAREAVKEYVERPFEYSLRKVEMHSSIEPSMVYDGLQSKGEEGDASWMVSLKEAAATSFLAASETTTSLILTFFLLMMLHPGAQDKAQAQIDAVIGKDRLPAIEDRPLLPFIDAIFRETLRHSPITPLLIPHAALDDDVYHGFFIPKGAIVLINAWAMAHDESRYPDPYTFIPERFLDEDRSLKPNDMEHIIFGFGRRMCPGRHFADASVWAVMAKVLAAFKISKPLDENGVEMTTEPKFSNGIGVRPLPFKCRFVPRLPEMDVEKMEELIAASAA